MSTGLSLRLYPTSPKIITSTSSLSRRCFEPGRLLRFNGSAVHPNSHRCRHRYSRCEYAAYSDAYLRDLIHRSYRAVVATGMRMRAFVKFGTLLLHAHPLRCSLTRGLSRLRFANLVAAIHITAEIADVLVPVLFLSVATDCRVFDTVPLRTVLCFVLISVLLNAVSLFPFP